ncbi:hypothetical protein HanPSC8_Chr05g0212341 [Helianthus annuus]|nr:hypothetical protein HanPSC8_Chr05g0212341 [Helianthus annuus]
MNPNTNSIKLIIYQTLGTRTGCINIDNFKIIKSKTQTFIYSHVMKSIALLTICLWFMMIF